jgi:hypothetical protein
MSARVASAMCVCGMCHVRVWHHVARAMCATMMCAHVCAHVRVPYVCTCACATMCQVVHVAYACVRACVRVYVQVACACSCGVFHVRIWHNMRMCHVAYVPCGMWTCGQNLGVCRVRVWQVPCALVIWMRMCICRWHVACACSRGMWHIMTYAHVAYGVWRVCAMCLCVWAMWHVRHLGIMCTWMRHVVCAI